MIFRLRNRALPAAPLSVLFLLVPLLFGCAHAQPAVIEFVSSASDTASRTPAEPGTDDGGSIGSGAMANAATATARGRVTANAVVVHVVDGDTIDVAFGRQRERIRLLGIDTPETKRPGTPIECYGPEASAMTSTLLPPGTPVYVERDIEARDRYGRLLAYVMRASDGLPINLALVVIGTAAPLTYAPNLATTDELLLAADEAKAAQRGIWARCGGVHVPLPA